MNEVFWNQIAILGGTVSEDGVVRLATALAEGRLEEIWDFEAGMVPALNELETTTFYRAAREVVDDGTGSPLTDDAIDSLKYAIIAAGRERFEGILEQPHAVAGSWDLDDAEDLAAVAAQALDMRNSSGDAIPDAVEMPGGPKIPLDRREPWVDWAWEYNRMHRTRCRQPWFMRASGCGWRLG
ncbi:DUF4240 domain-containing protein [Nocardioides sp. LHG3406-4]|uniref:DUF4240 domain-containing protein n=1 Tax=Nocardioides sp. LHG3406-4 TaxID=2804575 RepID=UPI003CF89B1E